MRYRQITGIVLLVYILLAGANIFTHEMWRDELHIWLTARASSGLAELFANMRCQGHPPLWYVMVYAVSRFTHNPFSMQVLHFAIAVACAGVFLRFAPFSRIWRFLFVLGYFPLYEYAAISRNYGIGILLIFCFCAACANIGKNFRILGITLILAGFANPYAFIIAICLFLGASLRAITDAGTRAVLSKKKFGVILCVIAVIAGFAIAGASMYPGADCLYASGWQSGYNPSKLGQTLSSVWQGLVPIPDIKHSYWNSNIMERWKSSIAPPMPWGADWSGTISVLREPQNIAGIALLCFFLFSFFKNRAVFAFFSSAIGGTLIFQYIVYIGAVRHFGHFLIIVIAGLWLEKTWAGSGKANRGLLPGLRNAIVYTLLLIHLATGMFASVMEWRYPFSEAKAAAKYIKDNGLDKLPIAGYQDFIASAAAGYLDRQIYYPSIDGFGTFVVFDGQRKREVSAEEVLFKTRKLAEEKKSDVVLMLDYEIDPPSDIIELSRFTGNFQFDESFYIYLVKYQGQ